jgi:hypothetical protein
VEFLNDLISGFLGAGFGAWAAFALERSRRTDEHREEEVQAGCEVLAQLAMVASYQEGLWKRDLSSFANDPGAWINMVTNLPLEPLPVDSMRLSFLLRSKDAHLVFEVQEELERHKAWIRTVNGRSEFRRELQVALDNSEILGNVTDEQIAEIVGPRISVGLKQLTTEMLEMGAERAGDGWKVVDALRGALVRRFPKENIPGFKSKYEEPQVQPANAGARAA